MQLHVLVSLKFMVDNNIVLYFATNFLTGFKNWRLLNLNRIRGVMVCVTGGEKDVKGAWNVKTCHHGSKSRSSLSDF